MCCLKCIGSPGFARLRVGLAQAQLIYEVVILFEALDFRHTGDNLLHLWHLPELLVPIPSDYLIVFKYFVINVDIYIINN